MPTGPPFPPEAEYIIRMAQRVAWLSLLLCLLAPLAPAHASPLPLAHNCPGGRFITTVEAVQRQNWIEKSPTVFDRKEPYVRLPAWLGRLTLMHASQGFLLSGEERLGQWTKVTVTLTMRLFGKSIYWPVTLPVVRDFKACRDANGDLYVR